MAAKPFVTVKLTLHDVGAVTIADYLSDGTFVNIGTQAAAAISRREAIHYKNSDGQEVVIPFHAIQSVEITKASGEYTPAEDEFCVSEDDDDEDGD